MREIWSQLLWVWQWPYLRDLIDILLVAFLVYELLRLVRGTRAVQMAVGLASVALLYQLSVWLELTTLQWVLRNAVLYFGFAIIVLFQHEIRSALTHLGNNIRIPFLRSSRKANEYGQEWYDEVVLASTTLASDKIGALIVFERDVGLKNYIESGVRLDARLTYDLLVTVFNPSAPLHDGAVIVSNNLVAGCILLPSIDAEPAAFKGARTRAIERQLASPKTVTLAPLLFPRRRVRSRFASVVASRDIWMGCVSDPFSRSRWSRGGLKTKLRKLRKKKSGTRKSWMILPRAAVRRLPGYS